MLGNRFLHGPGGFPMNVIICFYCHDPDKPIVSYVPSNFFDWSWVPICQDCYDKRQISGKLNSRLLVQE